MATIKISYPGQLHTEMTHLASGNTVVTDAPVDNNGRGEAFSPTDLVCAALGACMITTMGILANRCELNLEGTELEVTKVMAPDPRRIAEIIINFKMPARGFSDKEKQLLEKAARTCPVAISLHPEVKQTVSFAY